MSLEELANDFRKHWHFADERLPGASRVEYALAQILPKAVERAKTEAREQADAEARRRAWTNSDAQAFGRNY